MVQEQQHKHQEHPLPINGYKLLDFSRERREREREKERKRRET